MTDSGSQGPPDHWPGSNNKKDAGANRTPQLESPGGIRWSTSEYLLDSSGFPSAESQVQLTQGKPPAGPAVLLGCRNPQGNGGSAARPPIGSESHGDSKSLQARDRTGEEEEVPMGWLLAGYLEEDEGRRAI